MKPWHSSDRALFGLYGLWIAIGLVAGTLHIDDQVVAGWPLPPFLIAFVDLCLRFGDPILIALAAINTHSVLVRFWGRSAARRWLLSLVAVTAVIETAGTLTGLPFGHYAYTENFGPRLSLLFIATLVILCVVAALNARDEWTVRDWLGWAAICVVIKIAILLVSLFCNRFTHLNTAALFFPVLPLAIPLAWYVLIGNALVLWRSLLPGFIVPLEAAAVATLVTGIDWVMEPFAAKLKVYWLWSDPAIPLRNYLSWWVISFLLVIFFAKSPGHQDRFDLRPPVILGTMLALFAITRWTYGV